MRPTILFCGDTRGSLGHIVEALERAAIDAVVLLGDIQARRSLDLELAGLPASVEVWWIPGNHDTDSEADHDHLFGSTLADRNLHGRVAEVAGIRIAGLGGIFRGKVWAPPQDRWRGGLPLRHRSTIFPDTYAALSRQRADVLVTHEAPSYHPHGFEAIELLAACMGVSASFHGHHHDRLDYSAFAARDGFRAYGVGLRGITALDGTIVRVGELDAARAGRLVPAQTRGGSKESDPARAPPGVQAAAAGTWFPASRSRTGRRTSPSVVGGCTQRASAGRTALRTGSGNMTRRLGCGTGGRNRTR